VYDLTMRRVDILAEVVARTAFGDLADKLAPEYVRRLGDVFEQRFGKAQLPAPHESAIVAADRAKTAALLCDRVWSLPASEDPAPPNIGFYGATDLEICFQGLVVTLQPDREAIRRALNLLPNSPFIGVTENANRAFSEVLFRERAIACIPAYASRSDRDSEYKRGDFAVLLAAIEKIDVVDESRLTWEQVQEFRHDSDARASYRRFIRWVNREMVGKDAACVADEIEERLDKYRWALRKHGIETIIGIIETVIDPKMLGSGSLFVASLGLTAGADAAATAAVSFVVGSAALAVARQFLNLEVAKRTDNYEIAFVHEISELSSSPPASSLQEPK
jgi:hypothetical protein